MACLRLYGDPAARETTHRVLAGYGANVEEDPGSLDGEVLRRVLSQVRSGKPVDARIVRALDDPAQLADLILHNPELLQEALVVRGRSFMLGSDPARLQSLMY